VSVLELDRLSVTFATRHGDVQALRDVSLTVQPGEVVVLAGESGSGKTVLASALTGLLPRNAEVTGSIRLGDRELLDLPERALRRLRARELALVPQGAATALNPVRRLGRSARATARYRGADATAVDEAVDRRLGEVGLRWETLQRRYPHELSGGMQQRVVTTLATIGSPTLLLADEPTNGLDAALVDATADALLELRSGGASLVVITHDLRLARRLDGRLALLYASTLVELRDTHAVLDDPFHPYARGLVGALPERGGRAIPGLPPQLSDLPPGCPFAPRCPEVRQVCHEAVPAPRAVPGGESRCVLADEGNVRVG
jgi:peptide/nickel transport system ATP-binding protein